MEDQSVMEGQYYARKITEEFFYSEIGKTVREAIYNDLKLTRKPGFILTCGEYKSNNTYILYKSGCEPVIRPGILWYTDSLFIDDDAIAKGIVRAHVVQTYECNNSKNIVYKIERYKPFDLIWTTTIMMHNGLSDTYTKKIRVIPRTADDND